MLTGCLESGQVSDTKCCGVPFSRFPSVSLGESPPPAPGGCFGREELIEHVIGLAEKLEPIALIGAGGVGKTSIALTLLHHNRIKERFGEDRRFIRCDQFPASRPHFLARLSKVLGAGVENPEDLTLLRPLLSSKEILIILDNAESLLDPKGTNAHEIYAVVEELCQFKKVCICITSRITMVPSRCKRPEIPTLSMEAACEIFYGIYGHDERPTILNNLLKRLDFHALSITLLASTASQNAWDYDRLEKEWGTQRAQVLQMHHNKSLAATIELSLASPTFQDLGSDARDLLGVIAFFPQGIDGKNLNWLFTSISIPKNIFDGFCVLSLTYRSNGFTTMLAPIRDYFTPQDPQSSPLLCATRDCYFSRLSVAVDPCLPRFEEARWVASEDLNIEHLLDVFTSINQNVANVWDVCYHFLQHLVWHKPQQTVLKSRIKALPDGHPYKAKCLFRLSLVYQQIGNDGERKKLLVHALELQRGRDDDLQVAQTLMALSDANRVLNFTKEGIQQVEEALEIYKRAGSMTGQGDCLSRLAWLLLGDMQLDAAENAASDAINLLSGKGRDYTVVGLHRALGQIHHLKGEKEKAIHHFNTAIEIASLNDWLDEQFTSNLEMARLFLNEREYDNANAHIERAKSHSFGHVYKLGRAMKLQAEVWCVQHRLEDAKSEAARALENFEKSGAARNAELCRDFLEKLERAIKKQPTHSQGELLETILHPTFVDFRLPA